LNAILISFFSLPSLQTLLIQSLECRDHKLVRALASKVSFHHVTAYQCHASPNPFTRIQRRHLIWIYREKMKAKAAVN
jgi:hypothetical protein